MVVQALSGLVHSKIDGGHVEDAAQIVENLLAPDPALPIGLALQARVRSPRAGSPMRRLPCGASPPPRCRTGARWRISPSSSRSRASSTTPARWRPRRWRPTRRIRPC
jgi:hypothetical protein